MMCVTQVWGEGKSSLWTPGGPVNIPDGYEYLPAGDGALTRAVVAAAGDCRLYPVMRKDYKKYPARQVGFWAPAALIAAEVGLLAALRAEEHRIGLRVRRDRRQ